MTSEHSSVLSYIITVWHQNKLKQESSNTPHTHLKKKKKEKRKGAIFDAWEQTCLRLKSKGSSFKRRERKHFKAQEMWLLRMASEPRCPRCLQHIPGWQSLPYICGVSTHKTFSCMSRFYFNPGKWPRKVGAPNPFNSCSLMVHEKALKYYCKKVHLVQLREMVFNTSYSRLPHTYLSVCACGYSPLTDSMCNSTLQLPASGLEVLQLLPSSPVTPNLVSCQAHNLPLKSIPPFFFLPQIPPY